MQTLSTIAKLHIFFIAKKQLPKKSNRKCNFGVIVLKKGGLSFALSFICLKFVGGKENEHLWQQNIL